MGRRFELRYPRTALALGLVLVAVALPSGAMLVKGGDQLQREAELERKTLHSYAYKKSAILAERLSARLEVLRLAEARRPFYHYQNVYRDPSGVADGASMSPLSGEPANPYVRTYFQVDQHGHLTLPSGEDRWLAAAAGEDSAVAAVAAVAAVDSREPLADVALFALQGYLPATRCPIRIVDTGEGGDRGESAEMRVRAEGGEPMQIHHVAAIDGTRWHQHLEANDLCGRAERGGAVRVETRKAGGAHSGNERIYIVVSDFDWFTLPVAGEPGLVALRTVDTPEGTWTQGFVISQEVIGDYLKAAHYPARFAPVDRRGPEPVDGVMVPVEGTPWGVILDISAALAEKAAEAALERADFRRFFLLCALAASLAGMLVVGLVHQSERLAAQRAQFAASAAHELRTPLAGLRLYSEMLAEGLGDPQRGRDYACRLAGEAERLGRVVTNVLSFTRLERRTLSVDVQRGDLAAAVREVCERHRPALEEAGVALELRIPDDLPLARFDRDAVAHVVQNLLDNAEKYTRGVPGRRVEVGLEVRARSLVLTVVDNGPGVARGQRRRLFRPFARGDDHDATEGLGLGLVLVNALTTAQGGTVGYSDAPGGGAVFTVTFPRGRGAREAVAEARPAEV